MLHPRFGKVFSKLLGVWRVYQEAPREPERVTELAQARANLDDARAETTKTRRQLHPDTPPPAHGRRVARTALTQEEYRKLALKGVFPEG